MSRSDEARRAGFTLIEVCIVLVIFGLLAVNLQLFTKSGAAAARSGALRSSLENELELTLDRITFALMSAKDAEIEGPTPAPMPSSFVRFAAVIGQDADGTVLMSPTEQIAWASHAESGQPGTSAPTRDGGRVTWTVDADALESRRVTWSTSVPPY
jgi:prepilin-type N-terminal cleavage/methylation domain-containing protein